MRGAYLNTGIPGTGFYARSKIPSGGGSQTKVKLSTVPETPVDVVIKLSDDGDVHYQDSEGHDLPANVVTRFKRRDGPFIIQFLKEKSAELNALYKAVTEIHYGTPRYHQKLRAPRRTFNEPAPPPAEFKEKGWLDFMFLNLAAVDEENEAISLKHQQEVEEWQSRKEQFLDDVEREKELISSVNAGDIASMEEYFERRLNAIEWPQETIVSFQISQDAKSIAIDVDLPEIEDMPAKVYSVPLRGYKVTVKELGAIQLQKLYMHHIHAVGFRLIGEAFSALPTVLEVIVSGFSQRVNRATGVISDEYLYSVRVSREQWLKIDLKNVSAIAPAEALGAFDIRRKMTKNGVFKPVEPFGVRNC